MKLQRSFLGSPDNSPQAYSGKQCGAKNGFSCVMSNMSSSNLCKNLKFSKEVYYSISEIQQPLLRTYWPNYEQTGIWISK